MLKFQRTFTRILEEEVDERMNPEDITPDMEDAAYADSFDGETDMGEFSTDTDVPGFQSKYGERIKGWIKRINEFSEWLNGTESESLNKQIIEMDKTNSPFEGISTEAKKITAIAQDLRSFSEKLNGVILTIDKKQRDVSSQQGF